MLDNVTMRHTSSRCERVTLRDVSLDVEPGEMVAVAGRRRSGRTTLLRVAAGVTAPTAGAARFAGVDLARRSVLGMPHGIAYATRCFESIVGGSVLQQVAAPLLGRGCSVACAQAVAGRLLQRTDAAACATLAPADLDHAEITRVAVARALVTLPSLLLVDEPDEELLGLLCAIARHDELAVVLTTDAGSARAHVHRTLTLDRGTLRGERRSRARFKPHARRRP